LSTQLIRPSKAERLDIRCDAGDALVANLGVQMVFFFPRRLETNALARAFARALECLPIFAGRMGSAGGRMRIRCEGQGVPFTCVSSGQTMGEAIRSASQDGKPRLVDPVNGVTERWGWGPVCRIRVTHLADDSTAIGFAWHHAVGDMQTAMLLMNAWAEAAAGGTPAEPVIAEDRAAYLNDHLPSGGALEPGLRYAGFADAVSLARRTRKQRTYSRYFGADEIARMREEFTAPARGADFIRLSANDVVCAHIAEAIMAMDPAADRRTLAIMVNARNRCGLDPMLAGNILTTMNLDVHRQEPAGSIARRIRHAVDHFADEHCDLRVNQRFMDAAGRWRGAWCISSGFRADRWNLLTNWSGFGVYRVRFEDTGPSYFTPLTRIPMGGLGGLVEGADGRGLLFWMYLPPNEFRAMSHPAMRERLHRFRRDDDDIPELHRDLHG
jgi:hypothetical protein